MKKQNILIISILAIIALGAGIFQYIKVFQNEIAAAYQATKPANGHSWSEMQCTNDICVDTDNHKVGIGTDAPLEALEVNGSILASGDGDVCNGAGKCLNSVFQTNAIAGANQTCPAGQTAIMKANNGIWYTATASQVASSWSQVACGKVVTADGTPLLVVGNHTNQQCVNAGGTVVSAGGTDSQCRFEASSCPSGWTNNNWCTIPATTCMQYCSDVRCPVPVCSFGTAWGTPCGVTSCSWQPYSGCACAYASPGWINAGSCSASIVQIGCY